MDYKKLVYGVAIWAVVYLLATGFYVYKVIDTFWAKPALVVIVAVLAAWAGTKLNQPSLSKALVYSISWVVTAVVLDIILTVPFTGWKIFSQWDVLVSYALIIVIPLFTNKSWIIQNIAGLGI